MRTLICAGGSGVRVLEALIHLCAAGLGPKSPQSPIRVLVIDADASNGNGTRVRGLVDKYLQCQRAFGQNAGGLGFFGTELDLLPSGGKKPELLFWSPAGATRDLRELIDFNNLDTVRRDVAHLFFADEELNAPLDQGFRGHPAIGAAALSLLPLYRDTHPWKALAQKIQADVSQPQGSRLMVAGSVFGGTGAATFYPLTRFCRSLPEQNKDRLRIGVTALVPYFRFEFRPTDKANAGGARPLAAKSEWFALATRSAVEFYDYLRELDMSLSPEERRRPERRNWQFDVVYWVGDDSLRQVDFALGGPEQENPAHFVELIGALACLEFFLGDEVQPGCRWAGPKEREEEGLRGRNMVAWDDLPLTSMKRDRLLGQLVRFLLVGAVHVGFFHPLLSGDLREELNRRPWYVPWYWERFCRRNDRLDTGDAQQALGALREYFEGWHFPWWWQIHELDTVRLLNRAALRECNGRVSIELDQLTNLVDRPQGQGGFARDAMDVFFTDTVEAPPDPHGLRGPAAYLDILARAADRFVRREYREQHEGGRR